MIACTQHSTFVKSLLLMTPLFGKRLEEGQMTTSSVSPRSGLDKCTLIVPSAMLVSLVLPFEGKSSTAPLIVFLVGIPYFVICF